MAFLTEQEKTAIKCAYLDLKGAAEAHESMDRLAHDWESHQETIAEMETVFPFVKE